MKNTVNIRYCSLFLLILLKVAHVTLAQSNPKQLLIIIHKNDNSIPTKKNEDNKVYQNHQDNLRRLLNKGYLNVIGFLESGGGVFIGNVNDQQYIRKALDQDMAIQKKVYSYQMKTFEKLVGSFCLFKKGCAQSDLQLITFWPNLNKETIKMAASMEYAHRQYMEEAYSSKSILLLGKFDDKNENFVIYYGSDFKDFIYRDPAVASDYFTPEHVSFTGCELSDCLQP